MRDEQATSGGAAPDNEPQHRVGDRTRILVVDSVTELNQSSRSSVAVTASHGGRNSAHLAAAVYLHGAIFNDAGGGKEDAGISGLPDLDTLGIPAATVGHLTARIGDGQDTWQSGIITHANATAHRAGVALGLSCRAAATLMASWTPAGPARPPSSSPGLALCVAASAPAVWIFDSASMVGPTHDGTIAITGSHGGLLGGMPHRAMKAAPIFVAFNDASFGKDRAGASRLAPLQERGIAAVTVASDSARIGDGLSTYHDGVISAMNEDASRMGGELGVPLRAVVDRVRSRGTTS